MFNKKNIFRIFLTSIFVFVVYYYLTKKDLLQVLISVNIKYLIFAILIAWLIMVLTTWLTFTVRLKKYRHKLFDLIFYPVTQILWGYVMPVQGSLFFSTLYFKRIHNVGISKSISVNLFFMNISLFLGSLLGLGYSIFFIRDTMLVALFFIALFGSFLPLVLSLFLKGKTFHSRFTFVKKVFNYITATSFDFSESFKYVLNNKLFILVYLTRNILFISWLSLIAYSLEIKVPVMAIAILYFFMEVSLVFKFTPGNWGIQQLIGGILFSSIGLLPEDAVAITTFTLSITFLLGISFGILGNFIFFRDFNILNYIKKTSPIN